MFSDLFETKRLECSEPLVGIYEMLRKIFPPPRSLKQGYLAQDAEAQRYKTDSELGDLGASYSDSFGFGDAARSCARPRVRPE